jgi:hypothetical protein
MGTECNSARTGIFTLHDKLFLHQLITLLE